MKQEKRFAIVDLGMDAVQTALIIKAVKEKHGGEVIVVTPDEAKEIYKPLSTPLKFEIPELKMIEGNVLSGREKRRKRREQERKNKRKNP